MSRPLRRRQFTRGLVRAMAVGGAAVVWGRSQRSSAAAPLEVEVESRISAEVTRVGEPVQLTLVVRVRGADTPKNLPRPAALADNFEIGRAKTRSGSSGNPFGGPSAMVYSHQVSMLISPLHAGTFELGFSVEVDGQTHESNTPILEVLAAGEPLPEPPPGRDPTEAQGPVFLWAAVDKDTAYVGEQVTYALDVYERRSFLGIHLRKPPSFTDFFTEEIPEGEPVVKAVGGVDYRVRPGLRRALFP
ncbi:MAG: BatD family protein, partial [Deltaproteobacteria bacterium]|nr:BatD family protein [Deltaproteobacteria bacterium]